MTAAAGVLLFGGGIGINLADKAENKGLHVTRIGAPEKAREG